MSDKGVEVADLPYSDISDSDSGTGKVPYFHFAACTVFPSACHYQSWNIGDFAFCSFLKCHFLTLHICMMYIVLNMNIHLPPIYVKYLLYKAVTLHVKYGGWPTITPFYFDEVTDFQRN